MANGDLFGIGVSGLLAFQRALATTSHNVANATTEGYTRQRAELVARAPLYSGNGFIGAGVQVDAVRRMHDAYLVDQVRASGSAHAQLEHFHALAAEIDNVLGDPRAGLAPALSAFFDAVQGVANDPTSTAARQVLLSQAGALVDRFHALDQRLGELERRVNSTITNAVAEINDLAAGIADLNARIAQQPSGAPPNDLLDRREQLLGRLAELVGVRVTTQDDGSVSVFIGNGQSLVVGTRALALETKPNLYDPARLEVGYAGAAAAASFSDQLAGGSLAGALAFRVQALDPARHALGRVAVGIAHAFNDQHRLGLDLDGALGGSFFREPLAAVAASRLNAGAGAVAASVRDVSALAASDYVLRYDGANTYTLTRSSDGQTFAIATAGVSPYTTTIDGVDLTISAGAAVGDTFRISPVGAGAADIGVAIGDVRAVAAAAAVRAEAAIGNAGTGRIGPVTVNSPNDRVVVTFTGPNTFDVVDETTGAVLATGASYADPATIAYNGWSAVLSGAPQAGDTFVVENTVTQANSAAGAIGPVTVAASGSHPDLPETVTITFTSPTAYTVTGTGQGLPAGGTYDPASGATLSFNGWTVTLTGAPAAGDVYTVERNAGAAGDNRNALALLGLQTRHTLDGGHASLGGAYAAAVAEVGARTRAAGIGRDAQAVLRDQANAAREALSGVNLDEEAADLVRFQQAYQAAAQVISVADSLFRTLLDAVRR